jgi:6-phosphogluconolactonase
MNLLLSLTTLSLLASTLPLASAAELDFYIGTYTKKDASRGIYRFRLNSETGAVTGGELAAETTSPSFVAVHPNGKFVYAVGEAEPVPGQKGGPVSAFAIGGDGKLTLLNQQSSGGDGPCHVSLDAAGKNAFVANYGSGSIEALPIKADGRLGEPASFIQHTGTGPDRGRQEGPHAHSIYEHGGRVYTCDLGTDHIDIYQLDSAKGTLTPNDPAFAKVAPGAGPRHLAFGATHAYVISEMANTITVCKYDPANGALTPEQSISSLPVDFTGKNTTAEIFVHPNGKFLYGSNRGHDSIAVFAIGAEGRLSPIEHVSTQGKGPRNFAIDPTGTWLLAANQDSNNIVIFKIDPPTGKLTPTGQQLALGAPVCIAFVPVK